MINLCNKDVDYFLDSTFFLKDIGLQILPGFLDYLGCFLEVDALRHEDEAADLHDVPVGLPGISLDAGQGGIHVGAEQRRIGAGHQVAIEESRIRRL